MQARPAENTSEINSGKLLLGSSLALAGFLAMAYEVSWQRMLSLALGATLRSSALVLSCYMLGMGLGSWLIGRLADKEQAPTKLLGRLHWAMALSGLWGAGLLSLIPVIYRSTQSALATELAVHLVAVAALLPGAAASGGMLPATASAQIADRRGLGAGIGLMYSLEAMGSMAGVAAAGFLLIRYLGQTGTLAACLMLNLAAGAMLWTRRSGLRAEGPGREKREVTDGPARWDAKLLAIALAMGFVGMSLQVVWNRAVRIYLPNSTYTFTTVAAVYLAGLLTGNLAFRAAAGRLRRLAGWLFFGLVALSASIAIAVPLLARVPSLFLFPWAGLLSQPAARIFLPPLLVTAGLAFIPTAMLGFCLPLACRIYADRAGRVGGDIGLWRGVNTLGSALGPAAAGLVLLPLAGVSRSVWLMAGLAALAALAAAGLDKRRRFMVLVGGSLAAASLTLVLALPPVMVLPPSLHLGQGWGGPANGSAGRKDQVIYYRETAEGTVIVTEDRRTGIRACLVNNSAVVGTTYDAIKVVKMLGHLPFLCGARPGRALVVGFGIGVTAATIASHPEVDEVDCVEITPEVRRAAGFFDDFNNRVLENPKIRFIDGDGRHYLSRSREKYQIISADPTHPTLGCAQLYTREYFLLCRERLSEEGIICQYLPFHGLTPEEFWGAMATFRSAFPHSSLWLGQAHGVLVGSMKPLSTDFVEWEARVAAIQDPLFYKDPYALAACLLLDESGLEERSQGFGLNSDDRNYLEFFDPQAKARNNWERNISQAISGYEEARGSFLNVPDTTKWKRYRNGYMKFIEALMSQNRGDRSCMIELMRQAIIVVPENEEIRFLMQMEIER